MTILNNVSRDDIKTEQMIHWFILSDLIKYIDRSFMFRHDFQFDCETIRLPTAQKAISQPK